MDGIFGSGTKNALYSFQRANGIKGTATLTEETKKKLLELGYAKGTSNADRGLHAIDELGSETIFESRDGTRYKLFTGGEKVLDAKSSEFLYEFAKSGGGVLEKIINDALGKTSRGVTAHVTNNEINMGNIVINGSADQATVSEIRRAQRDTVEMMLKEFNRLNR